MSHFICNHFIGLPSVSFVRVTSLLVSKCEYDRKSFCPISVIFIGNFSHTEILLLQNHCLENSFPLTKLIKKSFGANFLSLQNHFLEYSYTLKILIEKMFGRNCFIVAKSFPKEVLH